MVLNTKVIIIDRLIWISDVWWYSFFLNMTLPRIKHNIAEMIFTTKIQCQRSNSNDKLPDNPPSAFEPNKPTITINKNTFLYCFGKFKKSLGNKVKNNTPELKLWIILAIDRMIKLKDRSPKIEPMRNINTKHK